MTSIGLGQRQPIHVGAEHHRLAGVLAAEHAQHTGLANSGAHLVEAQAVEPLGDDSGGPLLLMGELRVAVEIAPKLD